MSYVIAPGPFESVNRHRIDELMALLLQRLSADDYARSCRLIEAVFCPRRGARLNAADEAKAAAA